MTFTNSSYESSASPFVSAEMLRDGSRSTRVRAVSGDGARGDGEKGFERLQCERGVSHEGGEEVKFFGAGVHPRGSTHANERAVSEGAAHHVHAGRENQNES